MLFIYTHFFQQTICTCPVQTKQTLVVIKSNAVCVYAHIYACPDKAAQMYFDSINYAAHVHIVSNYYVVIKPNFFFFARTTCTRQTILSGSHCHEDI